MPSSPSSWVEPQLASPTTVRAPGEGWVLERKLDGVRVLAIRSDGRTRLLSRNRNDVSATYPEIVAALDDQVGGTDFVVDGEVVAFDDDVVGGHTSFGRLQKRIHLTDARTIARTGVPVWFHVFDLLRFDGHDVRGLTQLQRKQALLDLDAWHDALVYVEHSPADGTSDAFDAACAASWEGLIAKRADAAYRSGRSPAWLKLKCGRQQELVVGGWVPPTGSRLRLGALLVGFYDDGELVYAGNVGTGFTAATLADLRDRLDALAIDHSPFVNPPRERTAQWVLPELVAQVAFAEWTTAGRLRHPSFKGLRTDVAPADVRREP
ncbi:non-homologous end-joining DNA ligase [Solicola sp. PLA-1-18]|uniref:non-homologous end-joining DNA ligase n=1 Tax=Solicola sp. PLA-1-18 TaxID=3380532 RepID=UPI003B7B5E3D